MGKKSYIPGATRRANETARIAETLPDDVAAGVPSFFMPWEAEKAYCVADRVRQQATLYKCLLAHTAQADWLPEAAPSLWARIDDPAEEYPAWRQPLGAQDAYQTGDKVSFGGKHWVSVTDNNTWQPGVYGWEEVE